MNTTVEQLAATGTALRQALDDQDWNAVSRLDRLCRLTVEALMREPRDDIEQMRRQLSELLETYRDLVAACQQEKQDISGEIRQLKQSQEGARVYRLFG